MLTSPESSPRGPLRELTNRPAQRHSLPCLPANSEHHQIKRSTTLDNYYQPTSKRIKTDAIESNGTEDESEGDYDSELDFSPVSVTKKRAVFDAINQAALCLGRPRVYSHLQLTTRPILQSFVSSHRTEVFRCASNDEFSYLAVPYACAYSNEAKSGKKPMLAIGTEQGSVHIVDTTRRSPWEPEPSRTVLFSHNNAIFDVKWSPTSTLIATASGDRTTYISCPTTQRPLHCLRGHTSTVKCVAWDPTHQDILSTGGRDATVLIWDLRVPGSADDHEDEDIGICRPVMAISAAHGEPKKRGRKGKSSPVARTVTSLIYPESEPYGVVSSGAFDGILRYWDLRSPTRKSRSTKPRQLQAAYTSTVDPTTLGGSHRSRGITSLALGTGPTAGIIFALGADSRIHTYEVPTLEPLDRKSYIHKNLLAVSFYVRLAISPCGRWLASGCGGGTGSKFLFDVSDVSRAGGVIDTHGVELRGQCGEAGALDWADSSLATCADDATVRIWRSDIETYRTCLDDHEASLRWSWEHTSRDREHQ